jgi:hypothetical protein
MTESEWAWDPAGVVLEREVDGSTEQLWVSPALPSSAAVAGRQDPPDSVQPAPAG